MSKVVKHYKGDMDVQAVLGGLLRIGVWVSTSIVLLGGIVFLVEHQSQQVAFQHFSPSSVEFASVSEIFRGLVSFRGKAIIQFGVLLLIFTPIARVVFSIFSFLIERDYMYVLIGIIVLCVIITSLYLDIAH